jgi:transposase
MLWKKMYHLFMYRHEEFLERYHKRSNVETVFHMAKTKFGDSLKSKTKTAQINEVLLKFLCHNICVVLAEMEELGIRGDVEKVGCVLNK